MGEHGDGPRIAARLMALDDEAFEVFAAAYDYWGPHLFAGAIVAIAAARKVRADG